MTATPITAAERVRLNTTTNGHAPDPWRDECARALADVRTRLEVGEPTTRPPLFVTDAVELLGRTFDAARWLVTGLVTRLGVTMIGAEPKVAKTWFATEIAAAVATGTPVCGDFFAEAGTVAYFYAEDLDVQVRNRVRSLLAGANRQIPRGRLHLQPRGAFLDITRDEDLAWLVASARRLGQLDLLVLDPLRDVHGGEEDKSDSMRNVMRRLRMLVEVLGTTVLVVHHAPKASKDSARRRPGQNLRGSGAIHGSVDSGLYLEEPDGDGTNRFVNTVVSQVKGARSAGRFRIELTVTDDEHGEAVSAGWKVDRDPDPKATARGKREQDDDARMMAFVRTLAQRGESGSRTWIREHDERPIPEIRARASLDRLLDSGSLVLFGKQVRVPEPKRGDDW